MVRRRLEHGQRASVGRPRRASHRRRAARHPARRRTVGAHHIDLRPLQRREAGPRPLARTRRIAIRGERNPLSVRRPGRAVVAAVVRREIAHGPRLEVEQPDVGVAAAGGHERDPTAIRRDGWLIVVGVVIGEPLQPGAVDLDPIEIDQSVPPRAEDDPSSVRRERRVDVVRGAGHHHARVAALGIGDHDLRIQRREAGEGDRVGTVGVDRWRDRRGDDDDREKYRCPALGHVHLRQDKRETADETDTGPTTTRDAATASPARTGSCAVRYSAAKVGSVRTRPTMAPSVAMSCVRRMSGRVGWNPRGMAIGLPKVKAGWVDTGMRSNCPSRGTR